MDDKYRIFKVRGNEPIKSFNNLYDVLAYCHAYMTRHTRTDLWIMAIHKQKTHYGDVFWGSVDGKRRIIAQFNKTPHLLNKNGTFGQALKEVTLFDEKKKAIVTVYRT